MSFKTLRFVLSLVMTLFVAIAANAQTTATILGRISSVSSENEEDLLGATIVATHEPSGTLYGAVSREDGRFTIPNVRIGGPYTVVVSFVGFSTYTEKEISLSIGQEYEINVKLAEVSEQLEVAEVISERNGLIDADRTGAATTVKKELLENMPTFNRNLNDFLRLTPQSRSSSVASTSGSTTSFAGQDSRANNLTIDGSVFNNSFGLSGGPGGQTNAAPISLDAVQEIQVNLAPYDVKQAGFTGAGLNVVTRSGTNNVEGSVFFNTRNESFVGSNAKGTNVVKTNFDVKQYGFRLGAPIIKNKLFIFLNYESERRTDPASPFLAARPGLSGNNVTRVRASFLDSLSTFLDTAYNYKTGGYEGYLLGTKSDKALIKLDYNVNKNNRVSFRFNWLKSSRDVLASSSGRVNGFRNGNLDAINFENSNYAINNDIYSGIIEWNSVLSNSMFFNMQVGYTANRDYRSSNSSPFPLVDIQQDGRTLTTFGYERFTANNKLDVDTWQAQANLTKYFGFHTITAGLNFEMFKFANGFTPAYYGQYTFRTVNDFYNSPRAWNPNATGRPMQYDIQYSALKDREIPIAETQAYQPGFYLQDKMNITKNLNVTVGLRADIQAFKATALENSTIAGQKFLLGNDTIRVNTSKLPSAQVLVSPRVGFNWDVMGDKKIQVRGGTGLFAGRPPFVWISNQVGNTGLYFAQSSQTSTSGVLNNFPFNPNTGAYLPTAPTVTPSASGAARVEVNVTDPNFKFPQVWRTDLGVDYKLPYGIVATAEGLYTKFINAPYYQNINLRNANATLTGVDDRPYYNYPVTVNGTPQTLNLNSNVSSLAYLRNTSEGYAWSLTGKLEKSFKNGWYAMLAYNYAESKDLVAPGSIAINSFNDNYSVRGNNNPSLAYADNDQRHRIIGAASYRFEYLKSTKVPMATTISLFFQTGNQGRYSVFYNGNLNNDGDSDNDLLFIPKNGSDLRFENYATTGANGVTITEAEQQQAFDQWISNNGLNDWRGKYTERNGFLLPWLTTIDLTVSQEFGFKIRNKTHRIQVRCDLFNVGNLITSEWGVGNQVVNRQPLRTRTRLSDGTPVYSFVNATTSKLNNGELVKPSAGLSDVWQIQLGVRYLFD